MTWSDSFRIFTDMRKKIQSVTISLLLFWGGSLLWGASMLNAQTGQMVRDADGNVYQTLTIDRQVWMGENLKTTRYNDGTPIRLVKEEIDWKGLSSPAYCWYNNDEGTFKRQYGVLYNWYAVNTKKLCPVGWHVPSDVEWELLVKFLGGSYIAGGKLKETGTGDWKSPNTGATNESGFSALPGGYRDYSGAFKDLGYRGYWWTSYEGTAKAWSRVMFNDSGYASSLLNEEISGFSVRCVKDI